MRAPVTLFLPLFFLLGACSTNFPPAYVVQDLRVVSIIAEPPEIGQGGTSHVTAYLFDPDSDARNVSTRFYMCDTLDDTSGTTSCVADGTSSTTLASGDAQRLAPDFYRVSYDYTAPMDLLQGRVAQVQHYGFTEDLIVHGGDGVSSIDGFKRLPVTPDGPCTMQKNQNPVLTGFSLSENDKPIGDNVSLATLNRGTDYRLTPSFKSESRESYCVVDNNGNTQMLSEELSFVWSCAPDCSLDPRVTYADDLANGAVAITTPQVGAASGRFTINLVLRDGRGGEALVVKTFTLLPQVQASR